MIRYKVILSKTAEKELSKLPSQVIARMIPVFELLQENPRPSGCKKRKGFENL